MHVREFRNLTGRQLVSTLARYLHFCFFRRSLGFAYPSLCPRRGTVQTR